MIYDFEKKTTESNNAIYTIRARSIGFYKIVFYGF